MRLFVVLLAVASVIEPGDLVSISDISHVGCFSMESLPIHDLRTHDPMSWMECFAFCVHRLTVHMGVQQELGQATYNYCYCFGNISRSLTAVNESCISCPESPGHYCGGNKTISVYRIRESTPLSVVLATESGVSIFTDDNSNITNIPSQYAVTSVEIDFQNDGIYIVNNGLYCSYFSTSSRNYTKPKERFYSHYRRIIVVMLDWQTNNLYFPDDNGYIALLRYKETSLHHIFQFSSVNDGAIDSYNRLIFLLTTEKLCAYSLNKNQEVQTYSNKIERFEKRLKIALDSSRRLIYLLVSEDEHSRTVVCIDYADSIMRNIYSGKELFQATAFDVFNDLLVWSKKEDNLGSHVLYSCRLTPRCLTKDLRQVTSLNAVVNDIKIYHPDMQQPSACDRLGCMHDCTPTSLYSATCSCPDGMELESDKKSCRASGVGKTGKTELKHIGCYVPTADYKRTFRIPQSLKWAECVNLCNNRLSKFVGIESEESGLAFVICYCTDLIEGYLKDNSSSCQPCLIDNKTYCGGNGSLALYQLREVVPLAILLAVETGVKLFTEEIVSPKLLVNTSSPVKRVDFDYRDDEVFFTANTRVFRSYYKPQVNRNVIPKEVTKELQDYDALELCVNWVHHNVLVNFQTGSYNSHPLYYIDVDGGNVTRLSNSFVPDFMTIDPLKRELFCIKDSHLYRLELETMALKKYSNFKHSLLKPYMSIDIRNETIYTIAFEEESDNYIISMSYDTSSRRVLFSGPELTKPFGLAELNGEIIWGNYNNNRSSIYRCKLTPTCEPNSLKLVYQTKEVVNDIKIYHPDMQPPSPCDRLGCTHDCTFASLYNATCSCPDGMELESDKKSCRAPRVGKIAKAELKHIGCYVPRVDYKRTLRIPQSLKWTECVNLCNNRLSKFVGIESEESGSVFVLCYCTDLIEGYLIDNSSRCQHCLNDNKTYCGVNGSLALYQLREEIPLAILLAAETGVKLFTEEIVSPRLLVNTSSPVQRVDFDYKEDEVFFTENKRVFRSYYKPQVNRNVIPKEVTKEFRHYDALDLCVDWVHHSVLVKVQTGSYNYHPLYYIDVDGGNVTRLSTSFVPDFMTIDPLKREIFCIKDGHLNRLELETMALKKYSNFKHSLLKPYMSIDIRNETIYTIASEEENDNYIISMNYESSNRRTLFSGPELSKPFGLAEWNGEIVWGNYNRNISSIYRCRLTPTCEPHSLKLVYQTKENLYDLKIYHPNVQNITLGRLCLDRGCSHNCSIVPKLQPVCRCPRTMILSADNRTCIEHLTSTTRTSPTTKDADIVMTFPTTTTNGRKLGRNSDVTVKELNRPELFKTTKNSDRYLNTIQKATKSYKAEDPPRSNENKTGFLEIFVVCGVVIVIVLMVIQTLLINKRRRTNDYDCTYREASQIELRNTYPS